MALQLYAYERLHGNEVVLYIDMFCYHHGMDTVDTYMKTIRPDFRVELERIRAIVKRVVPKADETISYGMPTFKYEGKNLLHYAAFKEHMSIFPTSQPIRELEHELKEFKTAKGTLKFTLERPVPDDLIIKLATVRLA